MAPAWNYNRNFVIVKQDSRYYSTRCSQRRCSVNKIILRNFAKFTGNTCARVSFLIKLQAPGLYQKGHSGTGVFLQIFRNFLEHLFYRTPLDDCFCLSFRLLILYILVQLEQGFSKLQQFLVFQDILKKSSRHVLH